MSCKASPSQRLDICPLDAGSNNVELCRSPNDEDKELPGAKAFECGVDKPEHGFFASGCGGAVDETVLGSGVVRFALCCMDNADV